MPESFQGRFFQVCPTAGPLNELAPDQPRHALESVPAQTPPGQPGCGVEACPLVSCNQYAAQRADVPTGVHILRHTFCSHLAMHGAAGRAIQDLVGHQDLTMTQRYMHLSPNAVDTTIRLLERGRPMLPSGDIVETGTAGKEKVAGRTS